MTSCHSPVKHDRNALKVGIQVIDLRKGRVLQKGQLAIIVYLVPLMTFILAIFFLDYYRIIALS